MHHILDARYILSQRHLITQIWGGRQAYEAKHQCPRGRTLKINQLPLCLATSLSGRHQGKCISGPKLAAPRVRAILQRVEEILRVVNAGLYYHILEGVQLNLRL